ncbi:hypothetical protein COCNU_05G001830 [Cocos nucifera]|uniref:Uncharacterized protein n=1 Tax=Cocos nucifera TaxID=13894 RepID=A0A8K0N187_COCNU|nr:hypothetical protein COCNU_05G001830 [Cocos nucifera]
MASSSINSALHFFSSFSLSLKYQESIFSPRVLEEHGTTTNFLSNPNLKCTTGLLLGSILTSLSPHSKDPTFAASMACAKVSNTENLFPLAASSGTTISDTSFFPHGNGGARKGLRPTTCFPFPSSPSSVGLCLAMPLQSSRCCRPNGDIAAFLYCRSCSVLSTWRSVTRSFRTGRGWVQIFGSGNAGSQSGICFPGGLPNFRKARCWLLVVVVDNGETGNRTG